MAESDGEDAVFFSGPVIDGPEFCLNLSLGGPVTYPFDSDGDGVADVCSLKGTRREAIAHQRALERLGYEYPARLRTLFRRECWWVPETFGEPEAEAVDGCALGMLTPAPVVESGRNDAVFFSGPVIDGPEFCLNLSLGGPVTYPFDSDGDGVADVCSLAGTRRETVARQRSLEKMGEENPVWLRGLFLEECEQVPASFGEPEAEAVDQCVMPEPLPPVHVPGPLVPPLGAPHDVKLTLGNGEIGLIWNVPSAHIDRVDGIVVRWRVKDSDGTWQQEDEEYARTEARTFIIESLTNNTEYEVQVRVKDGSRFSAWSDSVFATAGVPTAIENLWIEPAGTDSLNLRWTPQIVAQDAAVLTGYEIQWSRQPDFSSIDGTTTVTPEIDAVGVSSLSVETDEITSLTPDVRYYVRIRAKSSVGNGPWFQDDELVGAPGQVNQRWVRLVQTDGGIEVAWAPPTSGIESTSYDVQWRIIEEAEWGDTQNTTGHLYRIDSLTNGERYEFRVRAKSANGGNGEWSTPRQMPLTVVGAPSWVNHPLEVTRGDGVAEIVWEAPDTDGVSEITNYTVQQRRVEPGSNWEDTTAGVVGQPISVGLATRYTFTGLTNNTNYILRVRAENDSDIGPWVEAFSWARPGAILRPNITEFPAVSADGEATVSWIPPRLHSSLPITGYDIQWDTGFDFSPLVGEIELTTGSATSHTITGLTENTTYRVRVRAKSNAIDSSWSTVRSSGYAAPAPASGALGIAPGDRQATVSWDEHFDTTDTTVTGYDVQWSTSSSFGFGVSEESVGASSTSYAVTGLRNAELYYFRVREDRSGTKGAWTCTRCSLDSVLVGLPTSPTSIELTSGDDALTVAWGAPSHNGGSAIIGYVVQWRRSGQGWGSGDEAVVDSTPRSYTISDLTDGAAYDVRVRAKNGDGMGARIATGEGPWAYSDAPAVVN